jgi:hypothetical protein
VQDAAGVDRHFLGQRGEGAALSLEVRRPRRSAVQLGRDQDIVDAAGDAMQMINDVLMVASP